MPGGKYSDEQVLRVFVSRMLQEKGTEGLSVGEVDRLRATLVRELDQQLEHAMITGLSMEELMRLKELLDRDATDEEVEQLFMNSKMDFAAEMQKAMTQFWNDYMDHGDNAEILRRAAAEYAAMPEGTGEEDWAAMPKGFVPPVESVMAMEGAAR